MIVIFSRNTNILSRLIRRFDKSKRKASERWSHTSIKLNEDEILDARLIGGVKVRKNTYTDYEEVDIHGNVGKAMKYIGAEYDVGRLLWYTLRWGKTWDNPSEFICSELVGIAANDDRLKGLTPNELYDLIMWDETLRK